MDQLISFASTLLLLTSASLLGSTQGQDAATQVFKDPRDFLGSIESYISERKEGLAMKGRSRDIFGLHQDPVQAKAQEVASAPKPVAFQKPAIPLQAVVDAIPITLVDSRNGRVVMQGSPPLNKGEVVEVAVGTETVRLRLEGVNANGAYFRDLKTQQLGLRSNRRQAEGIARIAGTREVPSSIQKIDLGQKQALKISVNLDLAATKAPNQPR